MINVYEMKYFKMYMGKLTNLSKLILQELILQITFSYATFS